MDKATQYKIKNTDNPKGKTPTAQMILDYYKIQEKDLFAVYNALVKICNNNGITIELVDLSGLVESEAENEADHKETCTSDGKTIFLHDYLDDHGGILTRVYDVLHMGCGHLLQRGASSSSGLQRFGEDARAIGSVFHLHADKQTLKNVATYELEAGKLGLFFLNKAMESLSFSQKKIQKIRSLYNDYIHTDHEYIINYYTTGISTNFFSSWKYNQPLLPNPPLLPETVFTIKKRTTIQIGLIRSDT